MEVPAMRNASEGNFMHRIYAEELIVGKAIEPFSCNSDARLQFTTLHID